MKHTLELNDRQLDLIRDLLEERLEDVEEDIAHFEEHPEEINADLEPGEDPISLEDYEGYRDEVKTLLSLWPASADEEG